MEIPIFSGCYKDLSSAWEIACQWDKLKYLIKIDDLGDKITVNVYPR